LEGNPSVVAGADGEESFLGNIITMDKSAVSMHNPESKTQFKLWQEKSKPGFIKDWSKQAK
jgi:hypothetical protein